MTHSTSSKSTGMEPRQSRGIDIHAVYRILIRAYVRWKGFVEQGESLPPDGVRLRTTTPRCSPKEANCEQEAIPANSE